MRCNLKIVHICLCGVVTDGYSYQDNLLTKFQKKNGHDVTMITSAWSYDADGKDLVRIESGSYTNEDGVKVIRLLIKGDKEFHNKTKRYHGVYKSIQNEKPDILFVHGCQFLDVDQVVKYIKKNRETKLFVDNHADFSNSAKGFISRYILHGILWRQRAKMLEPYSDMFYGVLPARVDFLRDIYHIPANKTKLLVMGVDDDAAESATNVDTILSVRKKYNINDDDFLIVTGGKIDMAKKQTIYLMKAVNEINNSKIKMILFGSIVDELKKDVEDNFSERVIYAGWQNANDALKTFAASNLAVFPGRHSVYWEQVVGLGIPIVCKYWEGTTHVDIGGNVKFIRKDTVEDIERIIREVIYDKKEYNKMLNVAQSDRRKKFLYSRIAEQSIRECL